MIKIIAIVLIIVLIAVIAITQEAYEKGYGDGYMECMSRNSFGIKEGSDTDAGV